MRPPKKLPRGADTMRNGAPSSAASRATATTMAAIESRGAGRWCAS